MICQRPFLINAVIGISTRPVPVALNKTLMLKTLHRPGAYYHNDYTITEHTF